MGLDIGAAVVAEPPFNDSNADLILLSSDGFLFYVHKLLLSLVSPLFSTMFTLPDLHSQEIYDGRPCVVVSDDARHLLLLLSWCDPRCAMQSSIQSTKQSLLDLQMVLETADKYGMESIVKRVEGVLISSQEIIRQAPLKVFAIAVRYRCEGLARVAARETLQDPQLVKSDGRREPELKHLSAFAFINLQEYHLRCVEAAVKVASHYDWVSRETLPASFFSSSCTKQADCPVVIAHGVWLAWWIDYMALAAQVLRERPTGSSVSQASLLSKIHSKIGSGSCTACHRDGHYRLVEFALLFEVKIDEEISKVMIFSPFLPSGV